MTAPASPDRFTDRLRRWWAAGCAALVLILACSTVSPSLHAWFHAAVENPATESDDCAVMLFAGGTLCPVASFAPAPASILAEATPRQSGAPLYLVTPRYLRQPERGPPVGRSS